MKKTSIYRPATIDQAIRILTAHGTEAGVYAGGTDLLIRLKNRLNQAPTHLVDIKKIASTLGGDLLQEVWCQYLRGGYSCWRNGGHICYGAIGDNSYYHSAIGGRLCYAVYPGDAATALIPFDARVRLATPAGPKELSLEQLVPGDLMVDGRIQSHVVRFNEILTEVIIPPPRPGLRASFEKLRPRGVWDFAMASSAMSLPLRGRTIDDARVALGGISGKPLRETAVETFLKGKTLNPALSDQTVTLALTNAAPLKYNAMKIEMAKGLLASGLAKMNIDADN